ncbi:MAG: replication restart helicase PriA [Actinomycetia bacterium]|nr:replication restart helicase PriA [Actinomycetes bacterium]
MTRVCRVVPDVTALERSFDYLVPDDIGASLRVGTIVRVPLHGRRVRAWVVEDGVEPETDPAKLLAVHSVVSAGPPADVVALAEWTARRWCGPRVAVLRTASPPNNVRDHAPAIVERNAVAITDPTNDVERSADAIALDASLSARAVLQWPPLVDRRRLVERLIAPAGSTIIAVADGSRAAALVDSLARRGHRALLLHSDASAAVRTRAWSDARAGHCVVIGGRVVAFAPVPDLAAAIVVDDADEALQEERVPTWHARDVLAERAARAGAHFAIVSAAPTTHAVVQYGEPLRPPSDVQRAGWPRLEIVDRREEPPGAGLYSPALADALRTVHSAGGTSVCVLNRRGRVRLLACDTCRALTRWDRSGAPAWSVGDDAARVARLGEPETKPTVCPHCGSTRLRTLRSGVTRSREELSALLGGVEVAEVDTATDVVPDAPVLVGTESVLHRAEVRRRRPLLVAFLDFDAELLAPRYRAAEQALWLLVRAAHLLMQRRRDETRVLVQTRQPDHEVLIAAHDGRPDFVVEGERARRRVLALPPFVALAELSGDAAVLGIALDALRTLDHQAAGVVALGPLAGTKEARALVRAPDADTLADALAATLPAARAHGRIRAVVDPPRV